MQYTNKELQKILDDHKKWLRNDPCGVRADLSKADLRNANLRNADLRNADLSKANLRNADLRNADLGGADLRYSNLLNADLSGADLSKADLSLANLKDADLRNADLDYSCLPLWCGSLRAHFDDSQLIQIAYHLVSAGLYSENASEETKKELSKLVDFANQFHRVDECGRLVVKGE